MEYWDNYTVIKVRIDGVEMVAETVNVEELFV